MKNYLASLFMLILVTSCGENASIQGLKGDSSGLTPESTQNTNSTISPVIQFEVVSTPQVNVSQSSDGLKVGAISFISSTTNIQDIQVISVGGYFVAQGQDIVIANNSALSAYIGQSLPVTVNLTDSAGNHYSEVIHFEIIQDNTSQITQVIQFSVSSIPVIDLSTAAQGNILGSIQFLSNSSTLNGTSLNFTPSAFSINGSNLLLSNPSALTNYVNQTIQGVVTGTTSTGQVLTDDVSFYIIDSSVTAPVTPAAPVTTFTVTPTTGVIDLYTDASGKVLANTSFTSTDSTLSLIVLGSGAQYFEVIGNQLQLKYPQNLVPLVGQSISVGLIAIDSLNRAHAQTVTFQIQDNTPIPTGCSMKLAASATMAKDNFHQLLKTKSGKNVYEVALTVLRAVKANSTSSGTSAPSINWNDVMGFINLYQVFDFLPLPGASELTQAGDIQTYFDNKETQFVSQSLGTALLSTSGDFIYPINKNNLCSMISDIANDANGTSATPTNYVADCLSFLGGSNLELRYSPANAVYSLMSNTHKMLSFNIIDGSLSECALETDFHAKGISDAIEEMFIAVNDPQGAQDLNQYDAKGTVRFTWESTDAMDKSSLALSIVEDISLSNFNTNQATTIITSTPNTSTQTGMFLVQANSVSASHLADYQSGSLKLSLAAEGGDITYAQSNEQAQITKKARASLTISSDNTPSELLVSLDDGFQFQSVEIATNTVKDFFQFNSLVPGNEVNASFQSVRDDAPQANQFLSQKDFALDIDGFKFSFDFTHDVGTYTVRDTTASIARAFADTSVLPSINTFSDMSLKTDGIQVDETDKVTLEQTLFDLSAAQFDSMQLEGRGNQVDFNFLPQVNSSLNYSVGGVSHANYNFTAGTPASGSFTLD